MGPLGKGSSSPEFWRNIQRYWISRRICRSISCSAAKLSVEEIMRSVGQPAAVCLTESQHQPDEETRHSDHIPREEPRCLTTHTPSTSTMDKQS